MWHSYDQFSKYRERECRVHEILLLEMSFIHLYTVYLCDCVFLNICWITFGFLCKNVIFRTHSMQLSL